MKAKLRKQAAVKEEHILTDENAREQIFYARGKKFTLHMSCLRSCRLWGFQERTTFNEVRLLFLAHFEENIHAAMKMQFSTNRRYIYKEILELEDQKKRLECVVYINLSNSCHSIQSKSRTIFEITMCSTKTATNSTLVACCLTIGFQLDLIARANCSNGL